jgi:hypothetical protein
VRAGRGPRTGRRNIPAALRGEAATQVAVSGSESFWALADELTAPVRA